MKLARNTAEGVKFTYFMMACFVHSVEWHSDFHLWYKGQRKTSHNSSWKG